MDEIDRANDRAQEILDDNLAKRKNEGPPACGACHFCSEPLPPHQRFCDIECRDDWVRLQVVEKSNGGKYYDEKPGGTKS